jgi:60 kDa SS-A/Ro ribonucleoprotein
LLELIFDRVIDDAKMLRTFVQILRSGVTGRKSLGSLPKRLVRRWFEPARTRPSSAPTSDQSPSLADIVKMVHPRPATKTREALYGYLIGRKHEASALPRVVREFEDWKADPAGNPPEVPFQMLTALPLTAEQWQAIARRAPWQMTRMNLNTFARHGVFSVKEIGAPASPAVCAAKSRCAVPRCSRISSWPPITTSTAEVPHEVKEALQDAMEIAISNVPVVQGK